MLGYCQVSPRYRTALRLALAATASLALLSPAAADPPQCDMSDSNRRTVVITKNDVPVADLEATFSLQGVLDKIIETTNPTDKPFLKPSAGERAALLQSMLRSLNKTSQRNADGDVEVTVDARPEGGIAPDQLLSGLKPVGLFNRLDLAPGNFENCGEHRIVYALQSNVPGRMTLIFEAKVKNPQPEQGPNGCLKIANFWKSLGNESDTGKILEGLRRFYFEGNLDADDKPDTDPVIHVENYGLSRG